MTATPSEKPEIPLFLNDKKSSFFLSSNSSFFFNALFPIWGDSFLQGVGFTPCTPKLRTTESDVLGRGQGRLERRQRAKMWQNV